MNTPAAAFSTGALWTQTTVVPTKPTKAGAEVLLAPGSKDASEPAPTFFQFFGPGESFHPSGFRAGARSS